uniref:Uncharacterized protein n=2 Tax=viral metagenome TaxID=1070528 RepID=A0A6M3KB32_9ZZZZ
MMDPELAERGEQIYDLVLAGLKGGAMKSERTAELEMKIRLEPDLNKRLIYKAALNSIHRAEEVERKTWYREVKR